jgi:alpha-mannosidase
VQARLLHSPRKFGGKNSRKMTISTALISLEKVTETDAVERNLKMLPLRDSNVFEIEMHPHEIVTIRLEGKSKNRPPAE